MATVGTYVGRVAGMRGSRASASEIEDVDEHNSSSPFTRIAASSFCRWPAAPIHLLLARRPCRRPRRCLQPSHESPRPRNSSNLAGQNFTSLMQPLNSVLNRPERHPFSCATQTRQTLPSVFRTAAVQPPPPISRRPWLAIAPPPPFHRLLAPKFLQLFPPTPGAKYWVATRVQSTATGFGIDPTKIAVKIGGANAARAKVGNVHNHRFLPSASTSSYPFFTRTPITLLTALRLFRANGPFSRFPPSQAPRPPPNHFSICKAFIDFACREIFSPSCL